MPETLLRIEQRDDGGQVVLHASGRMVASWPRDEREIWRAPESTVLRLNAELTRSLDDLRMRLRDADRCDPRLSELAFGEYVRSIHGYWGDSDADSVPHRLRRARLGDAFRAHAAVVETLALSDPLEAAKYAPRIEFIGSRRAPVPFELLPMGERPRAGEPLLQSCLRLPAFSAVVHHILYRSGVEPGGPRGRSLIAEARQYENGARAFLRSQGTTLWQSMSDFFEQESPRRTFDAAPSQGVLDSPDKVARYLLNPELLKSPAGLGTVVSDIHVYAHGQVGDSRPNRFRITFEYGGRWNKREFAVRSVDFEDAVEEVAGARQDRPMIWFNCCKAGGAVGGELFSVSVDLANAGCTVIAPRTETPEGFSTSFAQDFYRYLSRQLRPGQAFLAARLHAALTRSNPLGVLFFALGRLD